MFALSETCRCNRRISTNYRIFPPYNDVELSKDLTKVNMSGMIPQLLNNLVMECCGTCEAHGMSYVDFVFNGQKQPAYQHNENDVVERIDDSNDLSFPVYGWKWQDTYAERYRYIPLVESPGFAFLLRKPDTDSPLKAVLKSIFETWPYLLIVNLMALIAGIIIWFLVSMIKFQCGSHPEVFDTQSSDQNNCCDIYISNLHGLFHEMFDSFLILNMCRSLNL